jgi:hypothetical protein
VPFSSARSPRLPSSGLLPVLFTLALAAVPAAAPAQTASGASNGGSRFALGASAGTLGAGVELSAALAERLRVRLGLHGFSYSDRREADGIEYDAEARLRNANALLDWHPGGGGFRLTGGLVYNANTVEGSSLPPASGFYEIGDIEVPVALLGTLDAEVDFDPIVPYAGIGFGDALAPGRRFGVTLDLGVVFQGEPDVTLTPVFAPDSPIPQIPIAEQLLRAELAKEEQNIEDDLSEYDLYPVLALTLWYRF